MYFSHQYLFFYPLQISLANIFACCRLPNCIYCSTIHTKLLSTLFVTTSQYSCIFLSEANSTYSNDFSSNNFCNSTRPYIKVSNSFSTSSHFNISSLDFTYFLFPKIWSHFQSKNISFANNGTGSQMMLYICKIYFHKFFKINI